MNGFKVEVQNWNAVWLQLGNELHTRDSRCVETYEKVVVVTRAGAALIMEYSPNSDHEHSLRALRYSKEVK